MRKLLSLYVAKPESRDNKNSGYLNKIKGQSNCNSFISKMKWDILVIIHDHC